MQEITNCITCKSPDLEVIWDLRYDEFKYFCPACKQEYKRELGSVPPKVDTVLTVAGANRVGIERLRWAVKD